MQWESRGIQDQPQDGGTVIVRISQCLARLVRRHIPELGSESSVVFDSPAAMDGHEQNRLCLYLYQIENNAWLRNLPPAVTRRQGSPGGSAALEVEAPPLVVDLIYMMVPYGKSAEMELVLADRLVRLFNNFRALAGPWLDPVLVAAGNDTIPIVPTHDSARLMHEIWTTFPGKPYKLTQLYTLSPVRIPSGLWASADMVEDAAMEVADG